MEKTRTVARVDQIEDSPIVEGLERPDKSIGQTVKTNLNLNILLLGMVYYDRKLSGCLIHVTASTKEEKAWIAIC